MPRSTALSNDLRLAVARLSRRLRRSVADETLGSTHMSALGSMQKAGPLTLQELSARERVTPPSMLRTVQSLVDHGYVARVPHETDRRKLLLVITDGGERMIDETRTVRNAWLAQQLDRLSPDERQTLQRAARIMERLAECEG